MINDNNRYKAGKIYRITDIGYHTFYYGSTIQSLSDRMFDHKSKYKMWKHGTTTSHTRVYDIFDEYGHENCNIELVELFPCETKDELLKREGYYIQNNECVNKIIAGRTQKEWTEQNKERLKQNTLLRKDIIRERMQEYRMKHKDRLKNMITEWRAENKDRIKEHDKKYRELHRDEINANQRCLVICEICGTSHVRNGRARHKRKKKHMRAVEEFQKVQTLI